MRNFTNRCPKSGHFFSKLVQFYSILEKGQGRPPHPPNPPSSYAHNLIKFEEVDLFYRNVQFGCILALKCWEQIQNFCIVEQNEMCTYWILLHFRNPLHNRRFFCDLVYLVYSLCSSINTITFLSALQ